MRCHSDTKSRTAKCNLESINSNSIEKTCFDAGKTLDILYITLVSQAIYCMVLNLKKRPIKDKYHKDILAI